PCRLGDPRRRSAPSQRATSALAAHMDAYGPAVNDLKSLGTQKCTFGVHGPKQNRSASLRTPSAFYSFFFSGTERLFIKDTELLSINIILILLDFKLGACSCHKIRGWKH